MQTNTTRGLSLIEIIIVVAIVGVLSAIVAVSFHTFQRQQIQKTTIDTILSSLDSARARTLSAHNSSQFGVYFSQNEVIEFEGEIYEPEAEGNFIHTLDERVTIENISLNGGGNEVVFLKLTGDTNNYGTLEIIVDGISPDKMITISGTGLVSSN